MFSRKFIIIGIFAIILLFLVIVVVRDARQISEIQLNKVNDTEYEVVLGNERYFLKYVPKENITPFFGMARNELGTGYVLVRNDLPKRVRNFVMHHEIYHLYDFANNLHKSKISQEIHANLAAFPYEPLGCLQTIFMTLTRPERIVYYVKLIF